ncbi:MAG: TonB-dependent receptor, partial [Acidobacteriota bacterium]|nr:TonB-dependent receptor [Acidobacteriota bacterium]
MARFAAALIIGAFLGKSLHAQTASLTGRITDASGATVPGAAVSVTSLGTGSATRAETNPQGYYNLPSLPAGAYTLAVDKAGFRPIRESNLTLAVEQAARLDFKLEVGGVNETVEVSARGVLLDSESSTLGQVVQGKQVVELPLLGRNPYALAGLVPGVRPALGTNDLPVDQISTSSTSINGQRGNQNEYLLDGAPNTAAAQNQPVIYANVDSVQEFKVDTNSFSAEYGRAAGGVFNVITKAGTNDVHFSAYDFLRNDKLNANDWFANRSGKSRAPFRFNQFGGVLGGPVIVPRIYSGKDKTFFFVNSELVRFVQGVTFTATVPTARQLAGDFSQTLNAAGKLVQIYDPLTRQTGPNGTAVRTPFPGNVIPADRIDPVARAFSKFWPAPNTSGDPFTGTNNFVRTDSNRIQKNTFSTRVDHYFNARNRLFGRFSYDESPINRAFVYGPGFIGSPNAGPQVFNRRNFVLDDTHAFSSNLLGVFRYSYSRLSNFPRPISDGFNTGSLGFPPALAGQIGDPAALPVIIINGFVANASVPNTTVGGGSVGATDVIAAGMDNHAWQAHLTKTFSSHNLKTGFEYRLIRANLLQHADAGTQFSFANNFTQGPNPTQSTATAGSGLASFLLGVGAGSIAPAPALAQQTVYYAVFLQDDYKVTPTLTLNLGLRYDFESPRTDRFNQLTNFDSRIKPPLSAPGLDLHGALTFVGVNGASRYQANPDRNNLAPRVGLAWRATPKTVLRGGGGIFYAATTGLGTDAPSFGVSGFQATTSLVTSLDGITPINFLRNPYPSGVNQATGNSLGPATLLGQSISFFDRANRVPYSEQWNFDIERELPGSVLLDIGYAGSHGLKFPSNLSLN